MPETATRGADAGKRGRFDELFSRHHGDIYRYCVRRLGPADGEDAAADVFAVAWRRLDEVPQGDGARAWLVGVAYRVVGNQWRTRSRRGRLRARLLAMRPEETAAPADSEPAVLLAALDSLSRADRELLRMVAWDGLSRSDIARVLGIKENAVDQRLFRARTRLKARFDRMSSTPIITKETAP